MYNIQNYVKSDLNITSIISINRSNDNNWARPKPCKRDTNGLILITGGCIDYNFSGRSLKSKKGDVLFFPKDIVYSGVKQGNEANTFYVIDFLSFPDDACMRFPLPMSFQISDYIKIESKFNHILEIWTKRSIGYRLKCKAEIFELLYDLMKIHAYKSSEMNNSSLLSKIIDYIGNYFTDTKLNVTRICRTFYLSESQLRRLFYKSFSISPLKYIQIMRIDLARDMLLSESESMSLTEIAYSCGFATLSYFSRLFKQIVGISPSQFRKTKGL
jgi:AraC-like DNA-binding protein